MITKTTLLRQTGKEYERLTLLKKYLNSKMSRARRNRISRKMPRNSMPCSPAKKNLLPQTSVAALLRYRSVLIFQANDPPCGRHWAIDSLTFCGGPSRVPGINHLRASNSPAPGAPATSTSHIEFSVANVAYIEWDAFGAEY